MRAKLGAKTAQTGIAAPARRNLLLKKLLSQKYLQVMALLGVAWMIIFNYIPMYGIIIAFKQYVITRPISEAPWVGLEHFKAFFEDEDLPRVIWNTLGISLIKLIVGFPLPILFALFLNELRSIRLKKAVQTISYLPHFLSWVILGGILATWLSDVGVINHILMALHIIDEPISYLAEPKYFWGIVVASDLWKELGWSAIIYLAAISRRVARSSRGRNDRRSRAVSADVACDAARDPKHDHHSAHFGGQRHFELEFRSNFGAPQLAERKRQQRDRHLRLPDGPRQQPFLLFDGRRSDQIVDCFGTASHRQFGIQENQRYVPILTKRWLMPHVQTESNNCRGCGL